MKKIIYTLKRLLQKNHRLYFIFYEIITLNGAKLGQWFNRSKYLSSYGGCWTDRKDYLQVLNKKKYAGNYSEETLELVEKWYRDGYVILKNCISPEIIDQYLSDIEALKQKKDSPLKITGEKFKGQRGINEQVISPEDSIRVVDDYMFLSISRQMLLHKPICEFLTLIFEQPPVLTQSLHFIYGSGQAIHQDTAFVRMTSPFKLAACWIALEDIQEGSGELVYYSGSHRWTDFLFSGFYTHYDEERDGEKEMHRWHMWLENKMQQNEKSRQTFLAKKGDVLLWHAGLAHGGTKILDKNKTRLSLVSHYCPENARPLYHFYKPESRAIRRDKNGAYTSSHY
jgi:phytanoyl-CoA hydroxylase